jgi:hypothetical protein
VGSELTSQIPSSPEDSESATPSKDNWLKDGNVFAKSLKATHFREETQETQAPTSTLPWPLRGPDMFMPPPPEKSFDDDSSTASFHSCKSQLPEEEE